MDSGKEHLFSAKFACPVCSYSLQELEPRLFSFNNPVGACPKCDGLGVIQFFDPKRIVVRPDLSLAAGASSVLFPGRQGVMTVPDSGHRPLSGAGRARLAAQRIVLDGQDAAQEVDGGETRTSRRGK